MVMTRMLGPTDHMGIPITDDQRFAKDPELLDGDIYGLNTVDDGIYLPTPFEIRQRKEKEDLDREVIAIKEAQKEKIRQDQLIAEQLEREQILKESRSSSMTLIEGSSPNSIDSKKNGGSQLRVRPKVSFNCSVIQTDQLAMSLKQIEDQKKSNPLAYLKRRGPRKRPS